MEISPEPDHPALRNTRSGVTAPSLLVVVILGVLIGNAITLVTYEAYQAWRLQRALMAFTAMTERVAAEAKLAAAEASRRTATAAKAAARQHHLQQQLDGTCSYWQQQLAREDTAQNRSYRDMACARAQGLYR